MNTVSTVTANRIQKQSASKQPWTAFQKEQLLTVHRSWLVALHCWERNHVMSTRTWICDVVLLSVWWMLCQLEHGYVTLSAWWMPKQCCSHCAWSEVSPLPLTMKTIKTHPIGNQALKIDCDLNSHAYWHLSKLPGNQGPHQCEHVEYIILYPYFSALRWCNAVLLMPQGQCTGLLN